MYVILLLLLPVAVCRPQVDYRKKVGPAHAHEQKNLGLLRTESKLAQRRVADRRDNQIPDYQVKGFMDCCVNNLKIQGVSDKCIDFLCTYNNGKYLRR